MARTILTALTPLGSYPTLPLTANSADLTLTAADVANGNRIAHNGNLLLIARNSHATNPYTVTLTSIANEYKRTGDITAYSLAAGEIGVFGPFKVAGWKQADGYLWLDGENAAMLLGAVALP